jgi:hypothetical protein
VGYRLLLALLVPGCVFDSSGMTPAHAGATSDADMSLVFVFVDQASQHDVDLDAAHDSTTAEQKPPDVDQTTDMQSADLDTGPLVPCATKYGSVAGFKLCSEEPTQCVFYFQGGNCQDHCTKNGGTCNKAAAEVSNTCEVSHETTCATDHGDGLCFCSR